MLLVHPVGVMPPNYMAVLNTINTFQGGGAGNAGVAGEPIAFVGEIQHYLACDTPETCQRLTDALAISFVGMICIRTNPSTVHIG